MGLTAERIRERVPGIKGYFDAFEREAGSEIWRLVDRFPNIVLNGFYNDLFSVMYQGTAVLQINAMALGYGVAPTFNRTDTSLAVEWNNPVTTLAVALVSGTAYTSLSIAATPVLIPINSTIQLGTGQTVTTSADTAVNATTVAVTSFTASQAYAIGTGLNVTTWTPQRSAITLWTPTTTDPPQATWSFYFPAASNQLAITFTEAGLLYKTSSLTPAGSPSNFATHAAFAYTKNPNSDLRLDYTLARSLT